MKSGEIYGLRVAGYGLRVAVSWLFHIVLVVVLVLVIEKDE